MSDDLAPRSEDPLAEGIPAAAVYSRGGFSPVWLIPIIAALIGGFIAWRTLSEIGPTVTISFKSAEGLEAGQTVVKFKDLEVGTVRRIDLAEDLSHVIVTAEMVAGADRYLTEGTRFWVVRPRITASRVTGLGTLLSGSYIAFEPALDGGALLDFTGLETPPIVTIEDDGSRFTLRSPDLGSVDVGSPIYFRKVRVGEVTSYEMDPSGEFVTIKAFVYSPHDQRVAENTRFWNGSGIDVRVDGDGIQVKTVSFLAMLIGGIVFDTPESVEAGKSATEATVFQLYASEREANQETYTVKRRFMLHFGDSVEGLTPGAAVLFRGIQIGEVLDIQLVVDRDTYQVRVPVIIEIEPERLQLGDVQAAEDASVVGELVHRGLRAQLGISNLLTGRLQVELDLHTEEPTSTLILGGAYPEIPTIPTQFEEITQSLAGVVAKVERLPLDEIAQELRASLATLRATLGETGTLAGRVESQVAPALTQTLGKLDETLASISTLVAQDAPLNRELHQTLEEFSEAARSIRLLTDYLEQHPEALLRGKRE